MPRARNARVGGNVVVILDELRITYIDKEDLPKLYSMVAGTLKLAPNRQAEEAKRAILGGAMTDVNGLGTLRNRLSASPRSRRDASQRGDPPTETREMGLRSWHSPLQQSHKRPIRVVDRVLQPFGNTRRRSPSSFVLWRDVELTKEDCEPGVREEPGRIATSFSERAPRHVCKRHSPIANRGAILQLYLHLHTRFGEATVEVAILLGLVYFLPTFLAAARGHQSWLEILTLNLLLGWTVLGWIGALIWSLTAPRWETTVVVTEQFRGEDEAEFGRRRYNPR